MSYGVKYKGTIIDHFSRTVEVKVSELDYSGAITNVTLQGIDKTLNGSDDDLFVRVIGTQISVGFLSTTNFRFIDLYTGNSRKFKMQVYIDSVLDWVGWLIPENLTEAYDTPPYITQVTARDGLAELSSIPFELTLVRTSLQILVYLINRISLIHINVATNIFEENHNTANTPLIQTYVDTARYEGKNCEEVLNDLLFLWGARIYMRAGQWWFVNVVELDNPLSFKEYGNLGEFISESTSNTELLIGRPQNNKFAHVDQQLNILPAWKKVNVNIDLKKRDSFIKNYKFDEWIIIGTTTIIIWGVESGPFTLYLIDQWSFDPVPPNRGTNAEDIYMQFLTNNATPTDSVFQAVEGSWVAGAQSMRFNIKYNINNTASTSQFWAKIVLDDGAGTVFFLTDTGLWTVTEAFINLQNIAAVADVNDISFKTYGITSNQIPGAGTLTVSIFASDNGRLNITEFKGDLMTKGLNEFPDDFDYVQSINVNNNFVPDDIDLMTADFQDVENDDISNPSTDISNEQFVYDGGMYLATDKSSVTQRWQLKSVIDDGGTPFATSQHLDKLVSSNKGTKTSLPQWAISGSILSKDIQTDSAIVDYQVNNNKYLVCNGTYDMIGCIFNGTFIQVGSYSGAPWILAEGVWDDDGIWIDTEVWHDSDPTP